jgi:hypothetical protein
VCFSRRCLSETNSITFTNKSGLIISNAAVLSFNAIDVFYEVTGGGARVHLADLPPTLQQQFGYDPHKASVHSRPPSGSTQATLNVDSDIDTFLATHSTSTVSESWSGEFDLASDTAWNIELTTTNFTLLAIRGVRSGSAFIERMAFPYSNLTLVSSNFDKFFKWDAVASSHYAEPFVKLMAEWPDSEQTNKMRELKFDWMTLIIGDDLSAIMVCEDNDDVLAVKFTKTDMEHFQRYLLNLPYYKRELVGKIRRTRQQDDLFK